MKAEEPNVSTRLDLVAIIKIMRKWKRHLIITTVVTLVLGIVVTMPFFMPPQYESTVILYPSNLIPYSTESPTETMLQLLESDDIKDKLIATFHLYDHYEIDTTGKFPRTKMYNMLEDKLSISRTAFESVEISVLDKDPLMAARICDTIVTYLDWKARSLQRIKTAEVVSIYDKQAKLKKHELDSLELLQANIRSTYGILDFKSQSREISKALYKSGGGAGTARAVEDLNNLKLKGVEAEAIDSRIKAGRLQYNEFKNMYEKALSDYTKVLTYSNYVTKPMPAENKAKPKRTIFVFSLLIAVLFLAFIIILLVENYTNNIKPRLQS